MAGPLPPVPNVVQLQVRGTTPGEIWENVYNVNYSGAAPSAANLLAYATFVGQQWTNYIRPLCPSPIINTSIVATDLASNTGAQGVFNTNSPGNRGDDVIGSNTAFLISYPSSLRFRGGHFRTYLLCGGNADNQDGMNWHDAFVTETGNAMRNFLNSCLGNTQGTTTFTQLVGLKRHGKYGVQAPPPNPHFVLASPIIVPLVPNNLVPHKQMASQKGRIGRRSK